MSEILVSALTSATIEGNGVFDVLMRANKAHLEAEFSKNRIKGPEYATVYLGSLQQVLQAAMTFTLTQHKTALEADLLAEQILTAQAQRALVVQQQAQLQDALLTTALQRLEVTAQIAQITAQTALLNQQKLNAITSDVKVTAEIAQTTAQTALINQQKLNAVTSDATEVLKQALLVKEALKSVAETTLIAQQSTNLAATKTQIDAQTIGVNRQNDNLLIQGAQVAQQTLLMTQQTANALIEHDNLIKQGCVLASQFDLNMGQVARVAAETLLIDQKKITERAQTTAQSVDDSSVVGRQKALYQAQTAGFARNAEQAATKLMVDTWSIRRTTDTGTLANNTNQLDDGAIGRAVTKMLAGVGA